MTISDYRVTEKLLLSQTRWHQLFENPKSLDCFENKNTLIFRYFCHSHLMKSVQIGLGFLRTYLCTYLLIWHRLVSELMTRRTRDIRYRLLLIVPQIFRRSLKFRFGLYDLQIIAPLLDFNTYSCTSSRYGYRTWFNNSKLSTQTILFYCPSFIIASSGYLYDIQLFSVVD